MTVHGEPHGQDKTLKRRRIQDFECNRSTHTFLDRTDDRRKSDRKGQVNPLGILFDIEEEKTHRNSRYH